MDDKEIEKQLEDIKKSNEEMAHIIDAQIKNLQADGKTKQEASKIALQFAKTVEETKKKIKKSGEELNASIEQLNTAYKEHRITAEELEDELRSLNYAVNKTADQNLKAQLINKKAALESIVVQNKVSENLKETLGTQLTSGVSTAFKGMVEAGKQAMSSGDGIQTAGALMKTGIDIANNSVQVGANSMKDLGGQLSQMGGKAKFAGLGLSLLGSTVGGLANGMSELAKAGIDMMIKAVTKSIETYRSMAQSGALFANGIEGMRTSASNAGMSLEDFSKVASTNKDVFAKLGLGVTGGMQKMSGAMNAGGERMRKELFALGYSMEDQGNLMAQTMANMADPTGKLKASNEQVAAATKKYAQDLSMLAALTGEDMKAKQEKIKQENMELAVQQKLAKMTPEDRQKFIAMQASMNDTQRRQLKERMVYGTVISADLAVMEATSSGLKQQGDAFFQSVKDGTMSAEKGAELRSQYDKKIADDALAQGDLAAAGLAGVGGPAGEAVKAFGGLVAEGNKFTEEGVKETKRILEERKRQAETDPMVKVQEQQRDFGVKMDELTTKHMKHFGDALGETMRLSTKAMTDFANFAAGMAEKPGLMATMGTALGGLLTFLPVIAEMVIKWWSGKKGGDTGGPGLPDGKGKPGGGPSAPDAPGKPKGKIGRAFDAVKGVGSKILGLAPAAQEAASVASAAAPVASTAAASTGVLGKTLGIAAKGLKFLGPLGTVAAMGTDAVKGYQNAGANFDLKPGKEATTGQKLSSAAGSVLSGLSFGMLDEKSMSQGVHGVGSSVGNFFSKGASAVGNMFSGPSGAPGAAAGKAGLGSGYAAAGVQDPKQFLEAAKAGNEKLAASVKDVDNTMKDTNKHSGDMAELMKNQLTKHDEMLALMQEHLDISQRLLTQAQG